MKKVNKFLIKTLLLLLALPVFVSFSSKENGHRNYGSFSALNSEVSTVKFEGTPLKGELDPQGSTGHVHEFTAVGQGDNSVLFTCNATGCDLPGRHFSVEIEANDADYTGDPYAITNISIEGEDYVENLFGGYTLIYETFDSSSAQYINPTEQAPYKTGNYRVVMSFSTTANGDFTLTDIFKINHVHNFTIVPVEGSESKLAAICSDSEDNACNLAGKTSIIQLDARDYIYDGSAYPSDTKVVLNGRDAIVSVTGTYSPLYEYYQVIEGQADQKLQHLPSETGNYYVTATFGTEAQGGPWVLKDVFRIVDDHQHVFTVTPVDGDNSQAVISCVNNETPCEYEGQTFTVSISASNATYTGNYYSLANITLGPDTEQWIKAVNYTDTITYEFYEKSDTTFSNKFINPPVDLGEYVVRIKVDTVYIQSEFEIYHQHDLSFAFDGENKVVITCNNAELCCSLPDGTFTVILNASDQAYTGNPYDVTGIAITGTDNVLDLIKDINASENITYYFSLQSAATSSPTSTTAPTDLGDYYVYIYLTDKVIKAPFSITHTHDFTYNLTNSNTLEVTCNALGCPQFPNTVTFELLADDYVYDGEQYNTSLVTINDLDKAKEIDGIAQGSRIIYYGTLIDGSDKTTTPPTEIGTYYAFITIGDYTLVEQFDIYHEHIFSATVDPSNPAKATIICSSPGCPLDGSKFVVEISATDLEYNGNSYPTSNIQISNSDLLVDLVLEGDDPTFEYALQSDGIYGPIAPKDKGLYFVKTIFLSKTIYTTFEIKHTHNFAYNKVNNTIEISCSNPTGCDFGGTKTISITADSVAFTGYPYDAATAIHITNEDVANSLGSIAITYSSQENPSVKTATPPTDKGNYICYLTFTYNVTSTLEISDPFVIDHTHDFVVTATSGSNTATVTCLNEGCDLNEGTGTFQVVISATSNIEYTGSAVDLSNFTVSNLEDAKLANGGDLVFEFAKNGGISPAFSTNAPKDKGTYIVRVKIKDKYIQTTFKIAHTHSYVITVTADDTMTITCSNTTGCTLGTKTVKITASDAESTGNPYDANTYLVISDAIEASAAASALSLELDTYYTTKAAPTVRLETIPTDVGEYYAYFAVGTYVIKDEFKIYHNHNFELTIDGDNPAKLNVHCKNEPCDLGDFSIEITGPSKFEYTGNAIDATQLVISNLELAEFINGNTLSKFFYNTVTKQTKTTAPTEMGSYEYQVKVGSKTLKFAFTIEHTHEYKFEKVENTIRVYCNNATGCDFEDVIVSLVANDKEYDGNAYGLTNFTVINGDAIALTGKSYTLSTATQANPTVNIAPPTEIGAYVMTLKVGTTKITCNFEIKHTHELVYTYDGINKVTITCSHTLGCNVPSEGIVVSISAADALYTGENYASSNLTITGVTNLVTYLGINAEQTFVALNPTTLALPPKEAGTYKAVISGEGFEVYDEFTIAGPHKHGEQVYLPWESIDTLPASGYYYLTNDVTLTGLVTFTEDLHLCLNGHTIYTFNGLDLGIYDVHFESCNNVGYFKSAAGNTGSLIYGGSGNVYFENITITDYEIESTLIYGGSFATINFKNSTITGNTTDCLIAVNENIVSFEDVTITNNTNNSWNNNIDLRSALLRLEGSINVTNNTAFDDVYYSDNIILGKIQVLGPIEGTMQVCIDTNYYLETSPGFYNYTNGADPYSFFVLEDYINSLLIHYDEDNLLVADALPEFYVCNANDYNFYFEEEIVNREYTIETDLLGEIHVYGWSTVQDDPTYLVPKAGDSYQLSDFEFGVSYYALWQDEHGHFVHTVQLTLGDENKSGEGYTYTYNSSDDTAKLVLDSFYMININDPYGIFILTSASLTIELYNENIIEVIQSPISVNPFLCGITSPNCEDVNIVGGGISNGGNENSLSISLYYVDHILDEMCGPLGACINEVYFFNAPITSISGVSSTNKLEINLFAKDIKDEINGFYIEESFKGIKNIEITNTDIQAELDSPVTTFFYADPSYEKLTLTNSTIDCLVDNDIEINSISLTNIPWVINESTITYELNSEYDSLENPFVSFTHYQGEGHNLLLYVDEEPAVTNYTFNGSDYPTAHYIQVSSSLKFYNDIFNPTSFIFGNETVCDEDYLNPTMAEYCPFLVNEDDSLLNSLVLAWLDSEGNIVAKAGDKYAYSDFRTGSQAFYLTILCEDCPGSFIPYTDWTFEELKAYKEGQNSPFADVANFYQFDVLYSATTTLETLSFGPITYTRSLANDTGVTVKFADGAYVLALNGAFYVTSEENVTVDLGFMGDEAVLLSVVPMDNYYTCGIASLNEEYSTLTFVGTGHLDVNVRISDNLINEDEGEYFGIAFVFDEVVFKGDALSSVYINVVVPFGFAAFGGRFDLDNDCVTLTQTTDCLVCISLKGSVIEFPTKFNNDYTIILDGKLVKNTYFAENFESFTPAIYIGKSIIGEEVNPSVIDKHGAIYFQVSVENGLDFETNIGNFVENGHHEVTGILLNNNEFTEFYPFRDANGEVYGLMGDLSENINFEFDLDETGNAFVSIYPTVGFDYRNGTPITKNGSLINEGFEDYTFVGWGTVIDDPDSVTTTLVEGEIYHAIYTCNGNIVYTEDIVITGEEDVTLDGLLYVKSANALTLNNFYLNSYNGRGITVPENCKIYYNGTNIITVVSPLEQYLTGDDKVYEYNGLVSAYPMYPTVVQKYAYAISVEDGAYEKYISLYGDGTLTLNTFVTNTAHEKGDYTIIDVGYGIYYNAIVDNVNNKTANLIINLDGALLSQVVGELVNNGANILVNVKSLYGINGINCYVQNEGTMIIDSEVTYIEEVRGVLGDQNSIDQSITYYTDINFLYTANDMISDTMHYSNDYLEKLAEYDQEPHFAYCALFPYNPSFSNVDHLTDLNGKEFTAKAIGDVYSSTNEDKYVYDGLDLYCANNITPVGSNVTIAFTLNPIAVADGNYIVIDNFAYAYDTETGTLVAEDENGCYVGYALYQLVDEEYVKVIDFCKDSDFVIPLNGNVTNGAKFGPFLSGTYKVAVALFDGESYDESHILYSNEIVINNTTIDELDVTGGSVLTYFTDYLSYREFAAYFKQVNDLAKGIENAATEQEAVTIANQLNALEQTCDDIGVAKFVKLDNGTVYELKDNTVITGTLEGVIYSQALNINTTFKDLHVTLKSNLFQVSNYPTFGLDYLPEYYDHVNKVDLNLVNTNEISVSSINVCENLEVLFATRFLEVNGEGNLTIDTNSCPFDTVVKVNNELELNSTLIIKLKENDTALEVEGSISLAGGLNIDITSATSKTEEDSTRAIVEVGRYIIFDTDVESYINIEADKKAVYEQFAIKADILQACGNEEIDSYVFIKNTYNGIKVDTMVLFDTASLTIDVVDTAIICNGDVALYMINLNITADKGIIGNNIELDATKDEPIVINVKTVGINSETTISISAIDSFTINGNGYTTNEALIKCNEIYIYTLTGTIDGFTKGIQAKYVYIDNSELTIKFGANAIYITGENEDPSGLEINASTVTLTPNAMSMVVIDATGFDALIGQTNITINGQIGYAIRCNKFEARNNSAFTSTGGIFASSVEISNAEMNFNLCQTSLTAIYSSSTIKVNDSTLDIKFEIQGKSGTYGFNGVSGVIINNSDIKINNFLTGLYSTNTITVENTKLEITSLNEAINATNNIGLGLNEGSKLTGTGTNKSAIKSKSIFVTGELEITSYQTGLEATNSLMINNADITFLTEKGLFVTTMSGGIVIIEGSEVTMVNVLTGIDCANSDLSVVESIISIQGKLIDDEINLASTGITANSVYSEISSFDIENFLFGIYSANGVTFEASMDESSINNCWFGIYSMSDIELSETTLNISSTGIGSIGISIELGTIVLDNSTINIDSDEIGIMVNNMTVENNSIVNVVAELNGIHLINEGQLNMASSELNVTVLGGTEYCTAIDAVTFEGIESTVIIIGYYGIDVDTMTFNDSDFEFDCDKLCVQADTVTFDECSFDNIPSDEEDIVVFSVSTFEANSSLFNLTADYAITANEITLDNAYGTITANKVGLGKLYTLNENNTVVYITETDNFEIISDGYSINAKEIFFGGTKITDQSESGIKANKLTVIESVITTTNVEAGVIDFEKGLLTADMLCADKVYNSGENFFVINNANSINSGENVFKVKVNDLGEFELEGSIDVTKKADTNGLEIRTLDVVLASDNETRVTTENAFEITGEAVFGNELEDIITEKEKVAFGHTGTAIEGTFTLALLEDIHAGENTYRITFTSTDNKIKNVFILEGTIEIEKKVITIDWCEDDFTYNEEEQEITATYEDVDGQDIALTITLDSNPFKDAGSYVATVSFANNETNYELPELVTKEYTMKKFVVTIDWCEDNFTYNEEEQEITATYKDAKDNVVTLTITLDNNPFKEAGTYVATASFANDEVNNYELPELVTKEYTMKKFVVEITWTEDDFTYNGQEREITATYVDAKGNSKDLTVTLDNTPFKDAGDYIATASFANNETSYELPEVTTKSYTIKPCVIYIRWAEDDFTFNEQEQVITATYLDVSAQSVSLTVTVDPVVFKEAGTYTATVSFANNETNYALPENTTKQYHIKKKDVTITWCDDDYSYNGEEQVVTATYVNALGATVPLYITYNETFLNAGNYTVTATFANNEISYNFTNANTKQYTIKKIDYDMSGISFEDKVVIEEDNITEIKITGTLPTGLDNIPVTVIYTGNPTSATRGKYVVTATFVSESINYNIPEALQATLTIQWTKSVYGDGKVVVESNYGIDPSIQLVVKEIVIDKDLKASLKVVEGFEKNDEIVVGYEIYFAIAGIKTTLPNEVAIKVLYDESLVDQEAKVFFDDNNSYKLGELNVVDGYLVFSSKTGNKVLEVYSHYTLTWVMTGLGALILIEVIWLIKILEKKKRLKLLRGAK